MGKGGISGGGHGHGGHHSEEAGIISEGAIALEVLIVTALAVDQVVEEASDLKLQWISSTVHPFPRL